MELLYFTYSFEFSNRSVFSCGNSQIEFANCPFTILSVYAKYYTFKMIDGKECQMLMRFFLSNSILQNLKFKCTLHTLAAFFSTTFHTMMLLQSNNIKWKIELYINVSKEYRWWREKSPARQYCKYLITYAIQNFVYTMLTLHSFFSFSLGLLYILHFLYRYKLNQYWYFVRWIWLFNCVFYNSTIQIDTDVQQKQFCS